MSIKLVIFDMDGLMFDTERVIYEVWADIITNMGQEPSISLFSKSMGGHEPGVVEHYEKAFGRKVSMEEILDIFHLTDTTFPEVIRQNGVGIKKGLPELLAWLEEENINKVIASSSSQETIRRYLDVTGIDPNRFIHLVSGDMVTNLKPDPEIFLLACEKAGVAPNEAVVLEDSRNGLRAAVAAGIPCMLVPDLLTPDKDIFEKAYKVPKDLLEVIDIIKDMR